jgi:serine/threonine protein kinase
MAEVWKAWDTQLHRYVAIKVLHANLQQDPHFLTRFEREARTIASLHHPHIVQIYDFRISQASPMEAPFAYMAMNYIEGPTLSQYLHNTSHKRMFPSADDLLHLFTPICMAVDYAHEKGIIHRDIKPSNILLDERNVSPGGIGEPILSDFGIVKLLGAPTSTQSSWWFGTPLYASPEQGSGAAGDERSDIYSLGVILYEACVGMPPFRGGSPTAILMQHINAPPTAPTLINQSISPALAAVILRGLAKDPAERFPSASRLAIALAQACNKRVPEHLRDVAYQVNSMDSTTYVKPTLPASPALIAPSSTPHVMAHPWSAGSEKATVFPSLAPLSPTAPSLPPPLVGVGRQRRHPRLSSAALLALLLILASMGTLLLLAPKSAIPLTPVSQAVGSVYFVNSEQLNPDNSQGINDELLIDLHQLSPPQPGKAYYAWLLGDKTQNESVTPLGLLPINRGNVSLLYQGNQQHRNLLTNRSRFLVTEEDAAVAPDTYSPDKHAWRYYAELSQAPSLKDKLHFTMLDHLRHLLVESPELKIRGLSGGLAIWFLRNTKKVLEWGSAARDDWRRNPELLHRQIVRILEYLEGESYVQQDTPQVGTERYADKFSAQIALLGPTPGALDPPGYSYDDEPSPGYVYLVPNHLAGAVLSPDATASQQALAAQIHSAIDQVRGELEQVHRDAQQLVKMDETQLAQPEALVLLNDMVTQADSASNGQIDPQTGQLTGGVTSIYYSIQRMAAFTVKTYQA